MIEAEIGFTPRGTKLAATRCLPEGSGPFPTVLMIHGTGPLDRNENIPGQRLDVFNTIAHAIAEVGFASIRYDKRGCGKSGGNYHSTGHKDLVDDVTALVDQISDADWCDSGRLFLLGHSEGCLIAPQTAAQRPHIAGLVLICPIMTDVETMLRRQSRRVAADAAALRGLRGWIYRGLLAGAPATQSKLIDQLKTSTTDTIRFRFRKVEAKALRELLQLDVESIMSGIKCSTLLIGGGKDIQCDPDDVGRIAAAAQAPISAHVLPDMTHILRSETEAPSMFRYGEKLKRPLEPELLELITAWLRSLKVRDSEAQQAVPRDGLASLGRA